MTANLKYLSLSLFILITAFSSLSNSDILIEKITNALRNHTQKYPQEKVYLHLDRPYYLAGETIWFNAYLLYENAQHDSAISQVLYVDLVNGTDKKIVQQLILDCPQGTASGAITLPKDLLEDTYTIRAYTNLMRHGSDNFFFNKDVKIWQNKVHSPLTESELQQLNTVADCSFFPEGGNLVSKVMNRVGFKAVNQWGQGVTVEGFILEENKDTVAKFKSAHRGMGAFSFIPTFTKNYTAYIKKWDGSWASFSLPKVFENGYNLYVDNLSNQENIRIVVNNSEPKPDDKATDLVLVGQQKGKICFSAKIPKTKSSTPLSILKENIPYEGVLSITLFDTDGTPLCERLIFNRKEKETIQISITPDKTVYKTREKTTLTIEASNEAGEPVQGQFSLSAIDANQVNTPQYENNILSYMLLTSDLKGYIEDPAYYFDTENNWAQLHLDYLMMTQGWRRFVWKDILNNTYATPNYPTEQGLSIKGTVFRNKKPYEKAVLTLFLQSFKDTSTILDVVNSDANGRFIFKNLHFKDSSFFYIQAKKEKNGTGLTIVIDSIIERPAVLKSLSPLVQFDTKMLNEFLKNTAQQLAFEQQLQLKKDILLSAVEVTAKKKQKQDLRRGKYDLSIGGRTLDISQKDCYSFPDIGSIIRQKVPGVRVIYSENNIAAISRNDNLMFYLDGFLMGSRLNVTTLRPCEIEAIDVLIGAEASIFGMQAGAGIINIMSRLNSPSFSTNFGEANDIARGIRMGFTLEKEFYAPHYDLPLPEHDLPDYRTTLFWQPTLTTDKYGEATVSFWNTDAKTKVFVKVEGITQSGKMAVGQTQYKVE